jgi:upstream activation factor subunit UAF30
MAKSGPIRQAQGGLSKPMKLSPELAEVIGPGPMPRTEVTKALWVYIKENKLQDEKDKRTIVADEKLKKVFGGQEKVNMFEMTKLVSKHLS